MNQRKVINDHATDVSSAHHVCTAKYHERFIALVAGVEDLRDIQAKDPCFLEYEYEFDMPPSSGYYSDSSDAEESGEDGDEPANVYGSDLDFQEKWRIYHLKRDKIMGLCQSLQFARGHAQEVAICRPILAPSYFLSASSPNPPDSHVGTWCAINRRRYFFNNPGRFICLNLVTA
ncbi:hypothetical protein AO1008_05155 [Aspergillus oryzae 100-8]|uniref:Uncharacterized protein n=1 Tax=Aspergillus oryzae (strain 3.042) TaxID=1160506 RepID=I7ZRS4_ASPO3|nr:hypothetical protein Ao3042_09477 [Aspergillus oryzae 3.042]KDE78616.1 hypothetical protein AO1008_05155 [Aspergillus oryzae 100-8]|eukprot:EIT74582.1 hypothetical protein Ao3042_09477 [Aspergillus oryzae 3.042]